MRIKVIYRYQTDLKLILVLVNTVAMGSKYPSDTQICSIDIRS